jgi:hypothetical protein
MNCPDQDFLPLVDLVQETNVVLADLGLVDITASS